MTDQASLYLPKPESKRDSKKRNRTWRQMIVGMDGGWCMACGHYDIKNMAPHHIIFRSQGGLDVEGNGISLCNKCHKMPHGENARDEKGNRITGDEWMLMILDEQIGAIGDRWDEAREKLKIKIGRKNV